MNVQYWYTRKFITGMVVMTTIDVTHAPANGIRSVTRMLVTIQEKPIWTMNLGAETKCG